MRLLIALALACSSLTAQSFVDGRSDLKENHDYQLKGLQVTPVSTEAGAAFIVVADKAHNDIDHVIITVHYRATLNLFGDGKPTEVLLSKDVDVPMLPGASVNILSDQVEIPFRSIAWLKVRAFRQVGDDETIGKPVERPQGSRL